MLSDRERAALDEVQRRFVTEDPRFAASFNRVRQRESSYSVHWACTLPCWAYRHDRRSGGRGAPADGGGAGERAGCRGAGHGDLPAAPAPEPHRPAGLVMSSLESAVPGAAGRSAVPPAGIGSSR
jgi:hypothetical protein